MGLSLALVVSNGIANFQEVSTFDGRYGRVKLGDLDALGSG